MSALITQGVRELIAAALEEDIGDGDLTTRALISKDLAGSAIFISRAPLVVCGHAVVAEICSQFDAKLKYEVLVDDGDFVEAGVKLSRVSGSLASILQVERVALNFFQRLSGVSSVTREVVERVADSRVDVLDTRKTTPGFRSLEKYAVRTGGGTNHRLGLFDAVMIKNNHVDALGGNIKEAVSLCRSSVGKDVCVEVEVRNQEELLQALETAADVIMLDNMSPEEVSEAVSIARELKGDSVPRLEASGNLGPDNVADYAKTGVDCLSLGMLTHSAPSADISLRYED